MKKTAGILAVAVLAVLVVPAVAQELYFVPLHSSVEETDDSNYN